MVFHLVEPVPVKRAAAPRAKTRAQTAPPATAFAGEDPFKDAGPPPEAAKATG
jgi:hypothetical protein